MRVVVAASAAAAVAALAYAVSCKRKPKPDEVAAFEYTGKVVCVTSAAQVRVNIACRVSNVRPRAQKVLPSPRRRLSVAESSDSRIPK